MQQDLQQIEKALLDGGMTPHEAADYKIKIAGWYSWASGQVEEILALRPQVWNSIMAREDVKSAKAADREYEATEDGIRLMRLKMAMDRMDNMKSSLSSLLRVFENEARNIH